MRRADDDKRVQQIAVAGTILGLLTAAVCGTLSVGATCQVC